MARSGKNTENAKLEFQHLELKRELILPLGRWRELSWVDHRQPIQLMFTGVLGEQEGITLEAYLQAAEHTVHLSSMGLYGLKNASRSGDGLSVDEDVSSAFAHMRNKQLDGDALCHLILRPRFPLAEAYNLHIHKVKLVNPCE